MKVKAIMDRLRGALLCCNKYERKTGLDIGRPTNVRRVDISDALPGLTDAQRKHIREKTSSDAIHLLGLQSLPPSHPVTLAPSPDVSPSPSLGPTSRLSSREPSQALLNAASKDLPQKLPTPPRQRHKENSPPAVRMKSMREQERRSSSSSSYTRNELFEKLEKVRDEQDEQRAANQSFMTLNLDFYFEEKNDLSETPRTLSLTEGFEVQSTVGGQSGANSRVHSPISAKITPCKKISEFEKIRGSIKMDDSSDSEDDRFAVEERSPLVKI